MPGFRQLVRYPSRPRCFIFFICFRWLDVIFGLCALKKFKKNSNIEELNSTQNIDNTVSKNNGKWMSEYDANYCKHQANVEIEVEEVQIEENVPKRSKRASNTPLSTISINGGLMS